MDLSIKDVSMLIFCADSVVVIPAISSVESIFFI